MSKTYLNIILFLLISQWLSADEIVVCNTCEYSSIAKAIVDSKAGDVIEVEQGVYKEYGLLIDKPLELRGVEGAVIDGEDNGEIITIVSNNVIVSGLTIRNVGTSYTEDRAAIRVRKSKNFFINNNKLENAFFGIYLEHSKEGRITNNVIVGEAKEEMSSGNAIHAWYCENILIENNIVSHHRDGIYFEFVDSSLVKNNTSEQNLRYGLHFMFSNDDEYFKNTFKNNGAGVAVMFSKKIDMWENKFQFNWGKSSYGLLLKEIYDAEIRDNLFQENTIGIYVEGSTRINYHRNDFLRNGWAIKISGGCLDNQISKNNFLSNTFDLSVKNNVNDNQFEGNYWSEYSGYDLDKDGIGDVAYRPVKLFNYVVDTSPESMVLMRSLFVDLINFSEKVSPIFTPKNVMDSKPLMREIKRSTP